MKKFLSLLLALTMVMSLVVVPARADDANSYAVTATAGNPSAQVSVVKVNTNVTFTATAPTNIKVGESDATVTGYAWAVNNQTVSGNDSTTLNQAFSAAGKYTVSCTYTLTYDTDKTTTAVASASVTVYDCATAFTGVTFNRRPYAKPQSGNIAVYYDSAEANDLTNASKWSVTPATGYSVVTTDGYPKFENGSLKVKINYDAVEGSVEEVAIPITATPVSATSLTANVNKAMTGTKVIFTLDAAKGDRTNLAWYYKSSAANSQYLPMSVTKNKDGKYEWLIPDSVPSETYSVTCFLKESGVPSTDAEIKAVCNGLKITKDENKLLYNPAITATRGSEVNLSLTFTDNGNNAITGALSNVNWTVTPETAPKPTLSGNTVSPDGKTASNKLTIPSNASVSTYTVKAVFTHDHKEYTATFTVNINALTAKLSYGVQNGGYTDLYTNTNAYNYTNTLIALAENAIRTQVTGKSNVRVTSATLAQISGTTRGTLSSLGVGGYRYTAPRSYIGADTLRITAHADDGITYTVTLTVPVTPILNTSFASVNAEQLNTSNTSYASYKVSFPATYARYYVVSAVNGAAPADWSTVQLGTAYSATSPYTLTLNNLNAASGQVTLYIVAQRSTLYGSDEYYGGTMTVYLKDYNINYNGVAGETVQFKHADFTNFMNEVAQARGDSSKTTSYPYVTFNSVSFSMPSTTQGTLYYNGTAMSNSNASGAFNSRTQITNLDAVTFVPNAKTNVKAITLNFTLSGTKYTNYSASRGTPVTYTGTVVINLVREDIKYTVAAGDAISFTNTDFLNYLRTQSGINFNYDIDYVTFDQSAVNVMNEGVLYNGYSGYSQVKTTDKFYYTATNYYTQNALSDVTFRASPSAKNGATVYIPFTIYAKLSSSSIASRQVTGTVAIKIAQTMNFVDVKPTDYFYNSVKWALTKNITKGTSATTFSPYKTCTRAEIVTFLWRDAGSPMPTISNNPFTDVSYNMGADFYYAILWASQNGITAGTTATKFSPYDNCTRAQIVTFLWRYAKKPAGYASNPFTDVNKTDHASYYDAILWAVSKGITTGSTAKTFSPNGTCTRGEAVTFLYRYNGGK